jgi:Tfp pilus assembly protein FimV
MIDRLPRFGLRLWIALAMLVAGGAAQAAGPEAGRTARSGPPTPESAAGGHPPAGRSYVTVAGDNADRIVKKALADSPLKEELLREALIQANPKVFTAGRNTRLKPGTAVVLPDQHAMLRQILMPLLDPREAAAHFPPPPTSADERRRWVRYP